MRASIVFLAFSLATAAVAAPAAEPEPVALAFPDPEAWADAFASPDALAEALAEAYAEAEAEPELKLAVRDPHCDVPCQTDGILFHTPLARFISDYWAKKWHKKDFNYASDGCSVPGWVASLFRFNKDSPHGFKFINSCRRHDFGYQNYNRQHRLTENNRGKIDKNFKADMYSVCKTYKGIHALQGVLCRRIADVYFSFVRLCGHNQKCTKATLKKIFLKAFRL